VVVIRRDPSGLVTLPPRSCVPIPAALRHRCGLLPGDPVLLTAVPAEDTLTATNWEPLVPVDLPIFLAGLLTGQAAKHTLELADVPRQDYLGAAVLGVGDQVGQVRAGQHRGLIDDQQGARGDPDRAAGTAAAGQVAQELGGVVRHRDPGGQGVAGRLRRGDPDHFSPAGGPDPRDLG
jgi:hypothetical protein